MFGSHIREYRAAVIGALAVLVAAAMQLSPAAAAVGGGVRTVALSGAQAAGTREAFDAFYEPVLNDAGQVAFDAYVSNIDPDNYYRAKGIWSEARGPLRLVARGGDPAPGTPYAIQYAARPTINTAGETVFRATLAGSQPLAQAPQGIFRDGGGGLDIVAGVGIVAPSPAIFIPEMQFTHLGQPAVNNAGELALAGLFNNLPSGGYGGLWSGLPGDLTLVAHKFMEGGGLNAGDFIDGFHSYDYYDSPAINNLGHVAFNAAIDGPGIPFTWNEQSIWRYDGEAAALVIQQSDPIPGTALAFGSLGSPALNDAGQLAFGAVAADPADGNAFSYWGLWLSEGDELRSVVRAGDPAPGLDGVLFGSPVNPVINGAGSIAFMAWLEGSNVTPENDTSIWRTTESGVELAAREGDAVPGTGLRFADFHGVELAYNGAGQLAFMNSVGVGVGRSRQLWAEDAAGDFQRIAGGGMQLEVGPGDLRTITTVSFVGGSGMEDGRRTGFNELGQAAFEARFSDGSSGVFVSNLVAVPEPGGTMSFVVLSIAVMAGCRRHPDSQEGWTGLGRLSPGDRSPTRSSTATRSVRDHLCSGA